MRSQDLARLVVENLMVHRLRTLLSVLGIAIGTAAVIAVVAIGQGGRAVLLAEMEKLGSSRYFEIGVDYTRGEAPAEDSFDPQDAAVIAALSPAVEKMAPVSAGMWASVRRPYSRRKPVLTQILWTTPDFFEMQNLTLEAGRFLSRADVSARARVAVLDAAVAAELFPETSPLGKQVFVNETPATVVGVVRVPESLISGMMKMRYVYLPLTFAHEVLGSRIIHQLSGMAASKEDIPQAIADSLEVLRKRHPGAGVHYIGQSLEESLAVVGRVTSVVTLLVGAVAAIALVVGGVGVMNIMLVAVTERTREIGLLMALGARRRDILAQFLGEAVCLCLVGGFFGVVFGAGGAFLVALLAHWPPLVPFWAVLLAFGFSALVGLFFGIYPASRAASLSPAEALRHL